MGRVDGFVEEVEEPSGESWPRGLRESEADWRISLKEGMEETTPFVPLACDAAAAGSIAASVLASL